VDLGKAGIGEQRAFPVCPPSGGHVAAHRIGREVVDVAVPAGGQHHGVGEVGFDLAGDHVPDDHAAGLAVDDDQLQHLVPGVRSHGACGHLAFQGLVGAQQQLLPGLALGVEGAGDLHPAEGPVVQQAAVLAGERHPLGHGLVDDRRADLGEAVGVGLSGPEVAALDGVVEKPPDAVSVVAVVLGRVDAALGGDAVRPPRTVLIAKAAHPVAGLAQRRRGGRTGQPGPDDEHAELASIGGADQLGVEAPGVPAALDRALGHLAVVDATALDE